MTNSKGLTAAEALGFIERTEQNLDAFERTAPKAVAAMGGRDALARRSEGSCIGPMPRLTVEEWCAMSDEYEERRNHGDLAHSHRPHLTRGTTTQ